MAQKCDAALASTVEEHGAAFARLAAENDAVLKRLREAHSAEKDNLGQRLARANQNFDGMLDKLIEEQNLVTFDSRQASGRADDETTPNGEPSSEPALQFF